MEASTPKHLLDAPRTIGLTTLQENERDLLGKERILLTPLALVLLSVIVQAAATDFQSQAHFRGAVAGLFGSHLGDSLRRIRRFLAQDAQGFFKMSRCRLTVSSSRRNRAFSSMSAWRVGDWRAATPRRPASSRVLSIKLSPAFQTPDRHSQFYGQLLGRPNPRFQHPNRITLKLFIKAPAKFAPWFLIVLFHGFRSSLHLSARSKTPQY
jgi:hypothetical protein